MKIEISIGEAIDKYSILEIKMLKIKDINKLKEIVKELDVLKDCKQYTGNILYKILMYINTEIWEMTDFIKSMQIDDTNFCKTAHDIFEYNQKRFRLKNFFNNQFKSELKEQKSYNLSVCKIIVDEDDLIKINYLALQYDYILIDGIIVVKSFIMPNVIKNDLEINKTIKLSEYSVIPPKFRELFI
jgi:hypothetical protein